MLVRNFLFVWYVCYRQARLMTECQLRVLHTHLRDGISSLLYIICVFYSPRVRCHDRQGPNSVWTEIIIEFTHVRIRKYVNYELRRKSLRLLRPCGQNGRRCRVSQKKKKKKTDSVTSTTFFYRPELLRTRSFIAAALSKYLDRVIGAKKKS